MNNQVTVLTYAYITAYRQFACVVVTHMHEGMNTGIYIQKLTNTHPLCASLILHSVNGYVQR